MTTKPTPRCEIPIRGTLVGFLRRDIRQLDDDERARVDRLVERIQAESDPDQTVVRVTIETDYPDPDRLAYTAAYRVQVREECDSGPGECAGGPESG